MPQVFYMKADIPLNGTAWYVLPKFKDAGGSDLRPEPTEVSKTAGHLEWCIPDNAHNRAHVAKHYGHFSISKNSTIKDVVSEVMGELPEEEEFMDTSDNDEVSEEVAIDQLNPSTSKKLNPMQVKELKADISEQLTGIGIDVPKNPTLKVLQELLAKANPKN